MRMKRSGAVALLATSLALSACTQAPTPTPVVAVPTVIVPTPTPSILPATYTVRRGEVAEILSLSGRVAAELDQDVYATTSGFIRDLYVGRGDQVTAGQPLAELDPGDLPAQLERTASDLRAVENVLATTRRQRALSVESARIQLAGAEDGLNRVRQGQAPERLIAAQDKIERARISLANARNSTSAAKTNAELGLANAANGVRASQDAYAQVVWANGNRPLDQLDPTQRLAQEQAARNLEASERALQSAQIAYDLAVQNEINAVQIGERDIQQAELEYQELLAPPNEFELRAAERAVQSAQTNLAQAIASSEDPSANARIEQLQLMMNELESQLAAGKIYAPFDGVVGELGIQPGDQVNAYDPVMNIVDPRRLVIVVADINAEDLNRIGPGKEVAVSLQRYPDLPVAGRVERLPSDEVAPGSLVRPDPLLRISFEHGDRELAIGDVAEVQVMFSNEADALWLPPQAIFQFGQRSFVVRQDGDQQRQVDVQIGIRTAKRVQILEGLSEGDVVVGPLDLSLNP
jgi:RND family efflux transporter MFP subunit